jgi:hypothetical protein
MEVKSAFPGSIIPRWSQTLAGTAIVDETPRTERHHRVRPELGPERPTVWALVVEMPKVKKVSLE